MCGPVSPIWVRGQRVFCETRRRVSARQKIRRNLAQKKKQEEKTKTVASRRCTPTLDFALEVEKVQLREPGTVSCISGKITGVPKAGVTQRPKWGQQFPFDFRLDALCARKKRFAKRRVRSDRRAQKNAGKKKHFFWSSRLGVELSAVFPKGHDRQTLDAHSQRGRVHRGLFRRPPPRAAGADATGAIWNPLRFRLETRDLGRDRGLHR